MALFSRLCIIGCGLIGSSLARAARRSALVEDIVGFDVSDTVSQRMLALGLASRMDATPAAAVEGADLVVICAPVGAYADIMTAIAGTVRAGAILSDVGSVKQSVIRDIGPLVPEGVHFIPAHPVAGTEQSGPDAGFAELFDSRWCILTPPPGIQEAAIEKLKEFWTALGSKVEIMDPKHHDLVLSITSHLPHLIAYCIVGTAGDLETVTKSEVIKYSAGGFRDSTRLAASDPTMWRDVFLNNREAVLEMLGRFGEDLAVLQRAVRWGDGQALFDFFTRTRDIRRAIIDAGQETPVPDFGRRPPAKDRAS